MLTPFQSKQIFNSETLGERLAVVRRNLKWSMRDVADKLRVDEQYVQALESGDYKAIPGEIYIKNMLKRYAELLNVNVSHVMKLYKKEQSILQTISPTPPLISRSRLPKAIVTPARIKFAFVGILLAGIFGYLGLELHQVVKAPELVVVSPSNDMVTESSTITVAGQAEVGSRVFINDEEVVGDQVGSFSEEVTLQPGVNIIEVKAQKKRGKPTILHQRVRVETEPETVGLHIDPVDFSQ